MLTQAIRDLWMFAHCREAMDSSVDVGGNSQCTSGVIATLRFVANENPSSNNLNEPTREEIIDWMNNNNMTYEVEYLMEE